MSSYAAEHEGALADVAAAGTAVTCTLVSETRSDTTDAVTATTTTTVTGWALGVKGSEKRYADLGLIAQAKATLLFVPDTPGQEPPIGASIAWGGTTYTVRDVHDRVAPNGDMILCRAVIAV